MATAAAAASSSSSSTAPAYSTKKPTESDVYDRQIRLWGAEAQKKMQSSRVLYIHVTGVSSEVLKNLVLAGIAATLCDNRPASSLEQNPCFFTPVMVQREQSNRSGGENGDDENGDDGPASKRLKHSSVAQAVQPLVEELNPLLGACPILTKGVSELTADDLEQFTIVVASQIPLADAVRLSQLVAASSSSSAFYLVDCFGMHGAAMMDLGADFQYRPEQGKKLLDPVGLKDGYVSLADLVKVPLSQCVNRFHKKGPPPTWILYRCLLEVQARTGQWLGEVVVDNEEDFGDKAKTIIESFLKEQLVTTISTEQVDYLVTAGVAQVAPVCAVLGGILGNEVIKVISGKGEPANNTLLFDGETCKTWTFMVKPADSGK